MALVTVQRSPCGTTATNNCQCQTTDETDGTENVEDGEKKEWKGVNECYFAVKGAALVLPHDECLHVHRKSITKGASDIQQHLQTMLYLLHAEDILKMAVKLESIHNARTRYLVVASHTGKSQTEESCLLGIDCNSQTSIGLVLPLWADTRITLDGDGGFSITSSGRHHIFKPVSVQAMWSALQTLHKAGSKARECNYFRGGGTHQWIDYYEKRINSDRSCLNEWHAMDDLESKRPPSPDTVRSRPTEREETEKHIRAKLKELMMSVDLDEVTSKYIRTRLEEMLDMNLKEFKPFIDQEMITILGQMDSPTEIFQYLYLGSEWNASNLDELVVNGIGHILNVTREIDNFFPGMFDYQNIRVYDEETTEILHYWDRTYRYIQKAKEEGSKVLVHCKMGISRSASVVIAYVMKAYDWNLQQALTYVKNKRNCIKPNSGFLKQLEIYQGILDASKQRNNSLWRSKSETNLKCTEKPKKRKSKEKEEGLPVKSESLRHLQIPGNISRPKSWSPNDSIVDMLFPPNGSLSSEALSREGYHKADENDVFIENHRLSCEIATNPDRLHPGGVIPRVSSIKDRISELESQVSTSEAKVPRLEVKSPGAQNRGGLVLNLATQFESVSKPSSPIDEGLIMKPVATEDEIVEPILSQTKPPVPKHHAVLVKPTLWPDLENSSKMCLNINASTSSKDDCNSQSIMPGPLSAISPNDKKRPEVTLISMKSIDGIINKASHGLHDSAFRVVAPRNNVGSSPANITVHINAFDCSSTKSLTNTKKCSSPDFGLRGNRIADEKSSKSLTTPKSPCPTARNFSTSKSSLDSKGCLDIPPKANFIYDKEDIPFTPGTVQRTKKEIEEKSLTRTTSFDSGFPLNYILMPSTPIEFDTSCNKPVRRSRSLRSEHRPASMFTGKWYPLPALATSPFKAPEAKSPTSERSLTAAHSSSSPSVVEAVNEVICGTKEVINSAIQSMPLDTSPNCRSSIDSTLGFGSANSLPDLEIEDVFVGKTSTRSESPIPGTVRQQREILESKTPKTQDKAESSKRKVESSKISDANLVPSEDLGLVKRLTKELEAKSSSELTRKDKTCGQIDCEVSKSKSQEKSAAESQNQFDIGLGPRTPTGLRSSLPTSIEKKLSCNTVVPLAPPTPHRKTSLDLNFLKKSRSLKLHAQAKVDPSKDTEPDDARSRNTSVLKTNNCARTGQQVHTRTQSESTVDTVKTPGRPPHAIKLNTLCSPDMPSSPPLPTGVQRKVARKQHGSTHPLSRLTTKQRHINPLYNTM